MQNLKNVPHFLKKIIKVGSAKEFRVDIKILLHSRDLIYAQLVDTTQIGVSPI